MDHIELGQRGEQIAVNFLKQNGYQILDRNFRSGQFGEIDIVARDLSGLSKLRRLIPGLIKNAPLVFVEVKAKSDHNFGLPEEELTSAKQHKLNRAIQQYFWTKKIEIKNWRLDLVAIDFSKDKQVPEVRHYQGLS